MLSPEQIRKVCEEHLLWCIRRMEEKHGRALTAYSYVTFDLKGQCLGMAFYDYKISINLGFEWPDDEIELRDTVGHEYAHNVVHKILKISKEHPLLQGDSRGGHGRAWKYFAQLFGAKPVRCATVDIPEKESRPDPYQHKFACPDGHRTYMFSNRRLNAWRRGQVYLCAVCKKDLVRT